MKFQQLFLSLLILHLISACQEREVELELPYSGDRLVISCNLKASEPVKVEVSQTFRPLGIVPSNTRVSGATVSLTKNNQTTIVLSPDGKGSYLSDTVVEAGAEYVVQVIMKGFPSAESLPVKVPDAKPDFSYKIRKNVKGQNNPNIPQDLVSLYFSDDKMPEKYHLVSFSMHYEREARSSYWTSDDSFTSTEESCFAGFSDRSGGSSNELFLFRNECMPKPGNPVSFSLEVAAGRLDTSNNSIGQFFLEYADKARMRVANISQEWFMLAQSENRQPKGVDHFVQAPQETYTNVKNGYGVVYASNETSIDIDL